MFAYNANIHWRNCLNVAIICEVYSLEQKSEHLIWEQFQEHKVVWYINHNIWKLLQFKMQQANFNTIVFSPAL